jgi:type II secretory pathway component PulC
MNRVLFSVIALVLACIAIGVWLVPPATLGPSATEINRPTPSDTTANARQSQSLEDFAALADRPPFSASRRAARLPSDGTAALVLGRYRLSGIVVAPTSRSVILSGTDNRSIVVAEGETVDGWTVEEITPEKVVFTSDGRRQIFEVEQPGD